LFQELSKTNQYKEHYKNRKKNYVNDLYMNKYKYKLTKTSSNKKNKKRKIKKTRKVKPFVRLNCSPENKNNENGYTCYTDEDLEKIRNVWNKRYPDKTIDIKDTKEIWKFLKSYYSSVCNKESCWISRLAKGTKLEKELMDSFAPESPEEWKKNPNEWLSSIDIINVMNQYEKKYKCFEFMGPSPIDYDTQYMYGECVWEELCKFNLNDQLNKGKTKIGVIFNLDPHYKGGSHWVSLFINIKKGTIFYFDSAGDDIPKQIMKFVDDVIEQGKKTNVSFSFDKNYPVEHQYGNSECGVYSLYFIVHMLEDKITGHYLKTHIIKDGYIEKFRKIYFNGDL
jgi:hypothetical protein